MPFDSKFVFKKQNAAWPAGYLGKVNLELSIVAVMEWLSLCCRETLHCVYGGQSKIEQPDQIEQSSVLFHQLKNKVS